MQRQDSNATSVTSRGIRMSRLLAGRGALHAGSEGSSVAGQRPPTRRRENSYRTEPEAGGEFRADYVSAVCRDILTSSLDAVKTYDPAEAARLVTRLTSTVKQAVKAMNFRRYKLVVNVLLAENRHQGFRVASRCVWNEQLDTYACAEYTSAVLCAVVTVHGVYYE